MHNSRSRTRRAIPNNDNIKRKKQSDRKSNRAFEGFITTGSPKIKLDNLVEVLFQHQDRSAEILFDVAAHSTDKKIADEMLIKSIAAIDKAKRGSPSPDRRLRTEVLGTNMPLLVSLHLDEQQPDITMVDRAMKLGALSILKHAPHKQRTEDIANMCGAAAEVGVMLMLQRYGVDLIGDSDFTAVPSLYSQDNNPAGSMPNVAWNTSLFTGISVGEPTYAIQTKYSQNALYGAYHDQIDVVIFEELFQGERFSDTIHAIGNVCLHQGNIQEESLVNIATERLLDQIG